MWPRRSVTDGHPAAARMPILLISPLGDGEPHAADTSSSARCFTEASSNERCTWLVRVV
jgi:hypothetical protein